MSNDDHLHQREVAPEEKRRFGGGALGPFSQMLIVGLAVCALSLPLVTAVPALAAGTRNFAEHLEARDDSLTALWSRFREAFRGGGWLAGTGTVLLLGLLGASATAGFHSFVPGGSAIGWAAALIGAIAIVIVSRAAALWQPGAQWRELLLDAADITVTDPVGTLFVLCGYGVAAVVVWMLPALIVIAPGMVIVALVASERRRRMKETQ